MIVVDASAAIAGLLNDGPARRRLATGGIHVPHLADPEVASGLRRLVHAGEITAADSWRALDAWRRLALTRYPMAGLLSRIWELRDNVSAYDASYLALAETLDGELITADARLSQAAGIRCPVTVVPR
ncbi:type II toxin-antitoxin system VapC family toxin [Mycobacterium hubeiense]|uniref:type II toxin-antitoxin system VapC family toxin n=1 Tax=Mycobacterium hubeiense TaxID=1867256 RepID=UPI000C7F585C|nr:type II toxin-antitoxin system VapC family toxin [Mycobacterium sp. QGD 101]